MKRVLFFLQMLFVVLAYFLHAASAHADEPAPAPAPAASTAAAAAGKSDLDDDLPPDVRARLSQEQLHQLMMERAKKPVSHDPPTVAIVVPLGFFTVVFAIIVAALYAGYRKNRQRHETLRVAIERGANIPPGLLMEERAPRSDLRRGILLLSSGLGLGALLLATTARADGAWAASLIPTFLGLGYLLVHKLETKKRATTANANTNEPSPIV